MALQGLQKEVIRPLIGYIHYEAPEEERNFATLLEMLNSMDVREDDEEYQNPKHPNYYLTGDCDKKNLFDIETFLKRQMKLKLEEEYAVVNGDLAANRMCTVNGTSRCMRALWIKKSSQKESWQFRLTTDRCSDQKVVVIKDFL
jgi:hypothetical protein